MGMVVQVAEEGRRLVLRAVARRPLPGLDGNRPPRVRDQGAGGRLLAGAARHRHRALRVRAREAGRRCAAGLRPGRRQRAAVERRRPPSGWFAVQLPDGRTGFVVRGRRRRVRGLEGVARRSRPRTSSRPRGGSWACRTCGAAPRRRASTARASSKTVFRAERRSSCSATPTSSRTRATPVATDERPGAAEEGRRAVLRPAPRRHPHHAHGNLPRRQAVHPLRRDS